MADPYSFADICRGLGKPPVYIRGLQRVLNLYVPPPDVGYGEGYFIFLEKVVALRTLSVGMEDISLLFEREKKILELLHFDSLSTSPAWYLEACGAAMDQDRCLLLTNQDLGFPLRGNAVQAGLDFGARDPELFSRAEVGEDAGRLVKMYLAQVEKIRRQAGKGRSVLQNALAWERVLFVR